MVETIEASGGAVFVRCPAVAILRAGKGVEEGAACGVRLASGVELRAPLVVSGLGYRVTESLIARSAAMSNGNLVASRIPPPPSRLKTPQSCGFVMANIGLVGTAKELGISITNIWLQPATVTRALSIACMRFELAIPCSILLLL